MPKPLRVRGIASMTSMENALEQVRDCDLQGQDKAPAVGCQGLSTVGHALRSKLIRPPVFINQPFENVLYRLSRFLATVLSLQQQCSPLSKLFLTPFFAVCLELLVYLQPQYHCYHPCFQSRKGRCVE